MLVSNAEVVITTSTVLSRQKKSPSKVEILCPDGIKMYNQEMGGVDLVDQGKATYNLERIYNLYFINPCANNFIACNMMHPYELTLLDIKTVISIYRREQQNKTGSKINY